MSERKEPIELLEPGEEKEAIHADWQDISLSDLEVAPENCRKTLSSSDDESSIHTLAADLASHGLLHPLTVRRVEGGSKYQIIAGQRRFLAACYLGWKNIKCQVIDVDTKKAEEISLVENVHRNQMTQADKVRTYARLSKLYKGDAKKVAEAVSMTEATVKKYIKISNLPEEVLDKLDAKSGEGKMTLETAVQLSQKLKDDPRLSYIVESLSRLGTDTARKKAIDKLVANPKASPAKIIDEVEIEQLQEIKLVPSYPWIPDKHGEPLKIPKHLFPEILTLIRNHE